MTLGHGGGGVEDRPDALFGGVGITLEVELDERGVLVLGDLRLGDVGDDLLVGDRLGDVGDGGLEGGIVGLGALALDEHHLARLLREAGVVEDHGGLAALAVERLGVLRLHLAERLADHEDDDDERKPAEDGGLAMPGTPVPGAGGDALGLGGQNDSSPTGVLVLDRENRLSEALDSAGVAGVSGGPALPPAGVWLSPRRWCGHHLRGWHRAGSPTRSSWSSRRSAPCGAAMTPTRSIATWSSWRRCSGRGPDMELKRSTRSGARPRSRTSSRRRSWRPRRPRGRAAAGGRGHAAAIAAWRPRGRRAWRCARPRAARARPRGARRRRGSWPSAEEEARAARARADGAEAERDAILAEARRRCASRGRRLAPSASGCSPRARGELAAAAGGPRAGRRGGSGLGAGDRGGAGGA